MDYAVLSMQPCVIEQALEGLASSPEASKRAADVAEPKVACVRPRLLRVRG